MATSGVVIKEGGKWGYRNWTGAVEFGIITETGRTAQVAERSAKNPAIGDLTPLDTRQLEQMSKNAEQTERQLQPVGGTAAKRTTHVEQSQPAPGAASSQRIGAAAGTRSQGKIAPSAAAAVNTNPFVDATQAGVPPGPAAPEIHPRPSGSGVGHTQQAGTLSTPAVASAGKGSLVTLEQIRSYTKTKYPAALNPDGSVNEDFIKKNYNDFAIVKDIAMYVILYRDYKVYPVEKFVPGAITNPNLACVIFPPDKLVRMFVKTNQTTKGAFYEMKIPATTQGSTLHLFLFWLAYSYGVTNNAWVEGNQVHTDNSPWTNLLDILGIANQTKQELLDKMNDLIGTETSREWLTVEEKAILENAGYEFNTKIVEMGGKNYKRVYIEY